jgi:hypothetical protein
VVVLLVLVELQVQEVTDQVEVQVSRQVQS